MKRGNDREKKYAEKLETSKQIIFLEKKVLTILKILTPLLPELQKLRKIEAGELADRDIKKLLNRLSEKHFFEECASLKERLENLAQRDLIDFKIKSFFSEKTRFAKLLGELENLKTFNNYFTNPPALTYASPSQTYIPNIFFIHEQLNQLFDSSSPNNPQ